MRRVRKKNSEGLPLVSYSQWEFLRVGIHEFCRLVEEKSKLFERENRRQRIIMRARRKQ